MMRKFTFTLLMVLAFGYISFSQTYTASLQTITASPNESVSVNLDVTGFTSIGSFQFFVQIDPAVLTFQNVTNFSQAGLQVGTSGGNMLTLIWTNTIAHTWANGTLLTLNFTYNGLTSPIAFIPANCEVTKLVSGIPTILTGNFTNGAVSPVLTNTEQAHIGTVSAASGSMVTVPVTYTGSTSTMAGAITQRIAYDQTKLSFINATGSGLFPATINATASSGIITLVWSNPSGVLVNTSGTQFNLNFLYTGNSNTNVTFSTGCVISTVAGLNIPVTYNNGGVTLSVPPTSFASFAPAITNAVQGQMVDVPLTLSGMPSGTNNFDLHLTYDNPRLSFIGVINPMSPVTTNASGNTINISYVNPAAPSINGQFLVLRFVYNGVGTAGVNFGSGCQFSNGSPILVGYTNGSISPAPATVNANIGFVSGTSPSTVAIPVSFSNIPSGTNIGAVTLNIGFDASKLTYINALNPNGATVQLVGNLLNIAWSTTTATNINGTFITLNFNYAATGNATAAITFADGCQLASLASPYPIVPANWNNGGVNTMFKLAGTLTYDIPSSIALDNVTIFVKNGPEPIPPDVSPVPATLYSTTTNASGYFEVYVPNGEYYIYASTTKVYGGVDGGDVTQIRRKVANLTNGIDGSPIRLLSADVNQDGTIDGTDVTVLRRRVANLTPNPNYKAPDWIFENPTVFINGADMLNQNFKGLCSGDVNGTYPN